MPRWDYVCPHDGCAVVVEVVGTLAEFDAKTLATPVCPVHTVPLERRIGRTNFTIKGYTAATGYAYKKP